MFLHTVFMAYFTSVGFLDYMSLSSMFPLYSLDLTAFDMWHLICYLLLYTSPLISAEERRHINAEIHYNHTEEWLYGPRSAQRHTCTCRWKEERTRLRNVNAKVSVQIYRATWKHLQYTVHWSKHTKRHMHAVNSSPYWMHLHTQH